MSKEQILWLARDDDEQCWYELYANEPDYSEDGIFYAITSEDYHGALEIRIFEWMFPGLKLNPGECIKVKLTQTETGIRLEKI